MRKEHIASVDVWDVAGRVRNSVSGCFAKCCKSQFMTAINFFRDEINALKDWHFRCDKRQG